jgi:hypothetical protein
MASQASEAIEAQCKMADPLGSSSKQWTACGSETSHVSSDFVALSAMHDRHDAHIAQDVSLMDKM